MGSEMCIRDRVLIPQDLFDDFIHIDDFSEKAIMNFAKKVNIDPGIVVGRLQKEMYINYNRYNDLKTQYMIIS